jgi:hypothetical protein
MMSRARCLGVLSALTLLLPILAVNAQTMPNLLTDPGFESPTSNPPAGWQPFWTRTPGTGAMTLDASVPHTGAFALKVVHMGALDWSVAQNVPIPVSPGDVIRFGAWVKSQSTDSAEIALVTRSADGMVLDWGNGATETGGTHDWQRFTRACVVPPGCATVQFRFIGTGAATAWLDDAFLTRDGSLHAQQSHAAPLHLSSPLLNVTVSPLGLFSVQDRRDGRWWRQEAVDANVVVTRTRRLSSHSLRMALWDVPDDLHLTATVSLDATAPELTLTLAGKGPVTVPVAYPQPFVTKSGTGLVVPLNEGILYPVDDATVSPMSLVTYGGHGICMPWYGVTNSHSGAGVMTLIETPNDAHIDIARQTNGPLYIAPFWEESQGAFAYARQLKYVFFSKGGYVAQAKRYRRYAQATGLFKTLAQKRRENPNVDRLIGAVDVWNWDMNKVALCREMQSLGMTHVLWSSSGSPSEETQINALGFLTSRYDIYQDVWPPDAPNTLHHEGWPQDLVWLPDGDWMHGWADIEKHPDETQTVYQGGVINSERGLARAEQEIPPDLKTTPYLCRFLDTTTASPFREDYNPSHTLTRTQDRRYKMDLLKFCSQQMHLVVGSETGIDPAVPYVDYFEGMMSLGPYRLPDAGYDMMGYRTPTPDFLKFQVGPEYRIPLWELVYHDCVVADWYWGDSTNKAPEVWPTRDLYNILYGTPPLFMFDRTIWEQERVHFAQTYKNVCPLVRRLGYTEMLSHEFLSPDHAIQRTQWSDGTEIVVNFGALDYRLPGGQTVKAMGWLIGKKGELRDTSGHE